MANGLSCKIITKNKETVEVEISEQKLTIPIKYFPNSFEAGEVLQIYFLEGGEGLTDKRLAKTILEEILNGK